jgi:hypothetical protein
MPAAGVKAETEICSIRGYFWDVDNKQSSSWFLVDKFPLSFEDDSVTKLFHHKESGVDISVGVEQIKSIVGKEPRRIRLAIAFVDKPENVFDEVNNSEAETIYDKNWKWIGLSKNIKVENRIYTFQVSCERKSVKNKK